MRRALLAGGLGGLALAAWGLTLRAAADATAPALPVNPARVLCIAPSLTETVCFLGAGDRLVGRSDFCDTPPEVRSLPAVGGFYNPRLEDIARLRPDLVLAEVHQTWLLERCHDLGLAAVGVDLQSVDSIIDSLVEVGRLLGIEERGRAEAAALRSRVEAARVHPERPPRVLWVNYRDPDALRGVLGLGPGGPTHEILESAGAINALKDYPVAAPSLTAETILLLRPDVILDDVHWAARAADYAEAARRVWRPLLAQEPMRGTRLELLTDNVVNRPGPRIDRAIAALAEHIHGAR